MTGLTASTAYAFYVVAKDAAGNRSAASAPVTVTTTDPPAPDAVAPTAPGTPTASAITTGGVTLSWAASTDNVGVTGYRVYRENGATDLLVGSPTGTTLAVTGLTAATAYTFYVVAVDAAGNTSPASASVTVTTSAPPAAGACTVAYATNDWGSGFTANITISNTGTTAINGWSLGFTFPHTGQKVSQGWSATFTQTGTAVTATSLSYNGALAPGASTGIGFNGTHTGSNPKPTSFTLNGVACTA